MGEPGTSSGAGKNPGANETQGGKKIEDIDPSNMTADELKLFIDTGRTGRRNALPNVKEEGVITTSTADVSEALNALSFKSGYIDSQFNQIFVYIIFNINFYFQLGRPQHPPPNRNLHDPNFRFNSSCMR